MNIFSHPRARSFFCAFLILLFLLPCLPVSAQEAEEPSDVAPLTIGGVPLEEYQIIFRDKENLAPARQLQRMIADAFGIKLSVRCLQTKPTTKNILVIGSTALLERAEAKFYSYSVKAKGNRIFFHAYDEYAYANAFLAVVDQLKTKGSVASAAELTCSYTLPDRQAYLENPDLLYMRWAAEWTAPEWMTDYAQKSEALFGGNGTDRVWVNAHRADHTYYPENSLEAIISCYFMGVSVVELDLSITRDGVIVLMHDDTLTRMTNAADYIGKPGYPNTAKVADWTYAQLQTLCLKEGQGGSGAKLTAFKIPTFEEALIVCRNRMFIVPDKPGYWQYIDTVDVMEDSAENFLYPLMEKTQNFESVLISYGKPNNRFLTVQQALTIRDAIKDACGIAPYAMVRCSLGDTDTVYDELEVCARRGFAIQLGGDYASHLDYSDGTAPYLRKCTFAAWTIGTGTSYNDYAENWKTLADQGVRLLMTNDPMGMVRFAAEYQSP